MKGGFGVYTGNNPRKIAAKVSELISNNKILERMSQRAKQLSRPEATKAIASDIASVLLSNKHR